MRGRPPSHLPQVGDRVRLRGRSPTGRVTHCDPETKWTQVRWDFECDQGPRFCHQHELEILEERKP